jgi:hypothetical protein
MEEGRVESKIPTEENIFGRGKDIVLEPKYTGRPFPIKTNLLITNKTAQSTAKVEVWSGGIEVGSFI